VRLLVSELVANSVRHGMTSTADEICLEAVLNEETVRVAVTDQALGLKGISSERVPDPQAVSGRGLWLVAKLSDRWGIDNGSGSRVWFELDLGRVARQRRSTSLN
jgi:anti-sigma regulatory factor (Ser/Thr protein kinase)